jgi:hypothetical protein
MNKYLILTVVLLITVVSAVAQKQDSLKRNGSVFDRKKFFWGFNFNQTFGKIDGSDTFEDYFAKPNIGGDIVVEYFPLKFLGFRAGIGYMQRGTGIKLPDVDNSLGDPDSTYRTRLRMNTIEVPLALVLRTPRDVIKGMRLAGGIGIIPFYNFETNRIYHSVEDGFHVIDGQTDMYLQQDVPIQFFFGTHINVANYSQLQAEVFFTRGTRNVYEDDSFGDAKATLRSWGFRIAWMY